MKVLIVDDDRDNLDLVVHHLRNEGFDIITSRRGDEAFELMKKEKPDLAILDGLIPAYTGSSSARRSRRNRGLEDVRRSSSCRASTRS